MEELKELDRGVSLGFAKLVEELKRSKPTVGDGAAAWRKADLSHKFWDVQKRIAEILESEGSLIKVANCSRRIRKTTTVLSKASELCLKREGFLVRYVAPTKMMLRKIVRPIMRLITEDAPIELKPVWKSQDGLFYFPSTGSEIHIYGVNNGHEDDPRGTAAHLCVIDEAQLVRNLKYVVNDVLMPQLITTSGQLWMLLTPPKTPAHESVEFILEAKTKKGAYAEFDVHQSEYPPEIIEQFCKEAGGPESTTWKREYMCQIIVDTNFSLVPEWKDEYVARMPVTEFTSFYDRYEGMDIGVRHNTVNLYATYDFKKGKLFVQGETKMSGPYMTTDKLAKEVKVKEAELWPDDNGKGRPPRSRVADNSNLILIQDLGLLHGLHFSPTTKDTLEAMVNNVRLWISAGRLIVDPSCEQLIGCLKYGVWDDKRKDFETSKQYGHFDAFAALMYLLRYIDTNTNPIPPGFGINEDHAYVVRKEKIDDPNVRAIGKALGVLNGRRRQH